jgi:holo-[acyl-carrier protein] synthase
MDEWDIGVDVVEIARFKRLDYSSHRPFYERIFTPMEIEYCLSFKIPAPHFAANFAGKEAVYKAVRRHYDVKLWEIEILRDDEGAPHVNLHLGCKDTAENGRRGSLPFQIKVSLSHSFLYAVAFAVVNYSKRSVRRP